MLVYLIKRVILYVYDYEKYSKENGLNIDLFKELPGCTFKSAKDMMNMLKKLITNISYLNEYYNRHTNKLDGNYGLYMMCFTCIDGRNQ